MTVTPTMRIDVAPPEWLIVPEDADAHPTWREDAVALFTLVSEVDAAAEPADRLFDDGRSVDPEGAVAVLLGFAARMRADGSSAALVAGLTVPNRWPLPVVVEVTPADGDTELLERIGADLNGLGAHPAQSPTVEPLPEHLGTGVVVQRFDVADDGVVWATVAVGRRERDWDTVVLWRTTELEVLPAFVPDVVELVGAVQITGVPA